MLTDTRAGRNVGRPAVFSSFRMRLSVTSAIVAFAVLLAAAAPAGAQSVVSTPSAKTLYKTGPHGGRYLMDGTWLFKLDNHQSGPQARWPGIAGWKQVTVPNAWNVGDDSPAVVPRRRRLVSQGLQAAHRGQAALGGALRVGQLPLEDLAQRQADRQEPRRLPPLRDPLAGRPAQARRRQSTGHPGRFAAQADRLPALGPVGRGRATGGWWNYGGLLREVYLRKINDIDFNTVVVRPDLPCATCPATVNYRVTLRNYGSHPRGA